MGFSLGKTLNKAKGLLFGSEGPSNAYAAPDLSYLRNPGTQFDFLKNRVNGTSSPYFNQYVNAVNAPSSVDQVYGELSNNYVNSLLRGVNQDTNTAMGTGTGGYLRRGLISPQSGGVSSDIASSGLASIASRGAQRAGDIRLQYGLADLDRLKQRENALQNAYATQYGTETSLAQNYANLLNSRDLGYAGQLSGLYTSGQSANVAGRQPGLWDRTNINLGFGK